MVCVAPQHSVRSGRTMKILSSENSAGIFNADGRFAARGADVQAPFGGCLQAHPVAKLHGAGVHLGRHVPPPGQRHHC